MQDIFLFFCYFCAKCFYKRKAINFWLITWELELILKDECVNQLSSALEWDHRCPLPVES